MLRLHPKAIKSEPLIWLGCDISILKLTSGSDEQSLQKGQDQFLSLGALALVPKGSQPMVSLSGEWRKWPYYGTK